jgi:molybdopterin-guanine dinucleotide biosynthesis protein B/molybdopterin-guanine dinucleotide biosynthesis protein
MQNSHNDNNHMELISGALLAGGKSSRMKADKATLILAGDTLFSRGVAALKTVCNEIHIAGSRSDLASATIPSYADDFPGSSLGGLHTAIQHAANNWVCVLPCDLPFPSPRLVKSLVLHRSGYDAVVPRTPDGSEPLIACYHKRVLPIIKQQIKSGILRLTCLLDLLNVCYLDPVDLPSGWKRALKNLNSPQDLAQLNRPTPVLTFVAHSGTGKTTLVEKIILEMTRRGWTIGALKHDAHRFDIDHPGKDSWRLTQAGAAITAISSDEKTATIHQHQTPPTLDQILTPFQGQVDIILTEGFKQSLLPKIEVFRKELKQPMICRGEKRDPTLLAFAADSEMGQDVPTFPLNEPDLLIDFIEKSFLQ